MRGKEDLHKLESDLAASRAALEEERRAHVQASKEGAELSVEVVNQEAQLEWYANEIKCLVWENSNIRDILRQDDNLFDAAHEMTLKINNNFCLLGAPMIEKDFEEGDTLSAIEWSIDALGKFSEAISVFGGYCFSFDAQALVASIENNCEHVKVFSMTHNPFCSVDSLRKASQVARNARKRIRSFLWEREGIENFIRGQIRIRSLDVSILVCVFYGF